ncbi:MAG: hypothetical protein HY084_10660 [Gemmatimonadetes bacterium]|nr:hypothetical protein [Gemmatimonadota bacterium]
MNPLHRASIRSFAASAALGALGLALVAAPAAAQRPQFSPTEMWESGLINVPAAWVPPLNGDFALNVARASLDSIRVPQGFATNYKQPFYHVTASVAFKGRVEAGISFFSTDLANGLFAKALLWDQTDGIWRTGLLHWLPSVAVGVRNVGSESGLDRFGRTGNTGLNTNNTLYGVLTRTMVLGSAMEGPRPRTQLSLTAGMGNGLFSNDNGAGTAYSQSKTFGKFFGGDLQFATSRFSTLSLIAEHDAWDVNVGAQFEWRGVRAGLYVNEVNAGDPKPGTLSYRKVLLSLGWQTNVGALVRGNRMEQVTDEYRREAGDLQSAIAAGEQRVRTLEAQLKALQNSQEADAIAQRADLERRLREEQDAVKRLQELLKQRDAQKKP